MSSIPKIDTHKGSCLYQSNELHEVYVNSEPNLSERIFKWRIQNLK